MSRLFILFGLIFFLTGCATQQPKVEQILTDHHTKSPEQASRLLEQRVAMTAEKYKGKSYQLGANPDYSSQSDCSHLVCAVTRASLRGTGYGFKPYYLTTSGIRENSYSIPLEETRPGDLLLFRPSKTSKKYSHVGIITHRQGDTIGFTHASSSSGVIETSNKSISWKRYWRYYFDSFRRWNAQVFVEMARDKKVCSAQNLDVLTCCHDDSLENSPAIKNDFGS